MPTRIIIKITKMIITIISKIMRRNITTMIILIMIIIMMMIMKIIIMIWRMRLIFIAYP